MGRSQSRPLTSYWPKRTCATEHSPCVEYDLPEVEDGVEQVHQAQGLVGALVALDDERIPQVAQAVRPLEHVDVRRLEQAYSSLWQWE